jgi:hypothetical protein
MKMKMKLKPLNVILKEEPNLLPDRWGGYTYDSDRLSIHPSMFPLFGADIEVEKYKNGSIDGDPTSYGFKCRNGWHFCESWFEPGSVVGEKVNRTLVNLQLILPDNITMENITNCLESQYNVDHIGNINSMLLEVSKKVD